MGTEQSADTGSEASIVSRIAALSAPATPELAPKAEPAAAPVQQDAQTEAEPAETQAAAEDQTAEGEQPESDDWVEFTDDDGEVIPVHKKLEARVKNWSTFSQEKAEVTKLREQANDRMMFAEAREQIVAAVMGEVSDLRATQSELAKYRSVDWQAAFNENPGQAMAAQHRMHQLERQEGEKTQAIQQKAAHISQATQAHNAKQWELAEQGVIQRIGKITEKDNVAMAKLVTSLGFTVDEFKSRFADPRILHMAYKAARSDALEASKPSALSAVRKAPPVVKPGASKGPGVAIEQKYRDQRQALRKSGSVQDAAKLFLLRN